MLAPSLAPPADAGKASLAPPAAKKAEPIHLPPTTHLPPVEQPRPQQSVDIADDSYISDGSDSEEVETVLGAETFSDLDDLDESTMEGGYIVNP